MPMKIPSDNLFHLIIKTATQFVLLGLENMLKKDILSKINQRNDREKWRGPRQRGMSNVNL